MKFKDILNIGGTIASAVFPPVGLAIKAVNEFLPDDKKLPETATVNDIKGKLDGLTPEQQASLYERDIELKIAESANWAEVAKAHEAADATGNTTRPAIAMKMTELFIKYAMWSFGLVMIAMSADILAGVLGQDTEFTQIVMDNLAWLAAVYAVPAMNVIVSYFAKRSDEKRARYAVSGQQPIPSSVGLIGSILGAIKK